MYIGTGFRLLPSAFRLLPSYFCLPTSAFRLPPSAAAIATVNATVYLYGGQTGENYGEIRMDYVDQAGPVILAGPYTSTFGGRVGTNSTNPSTISGVISEINGSQDFVLAGRITLTLTAANTFTGETRFNKANTNNTAALVLGNALALQYSTLNHKNASSTTSSVKFAPGIGSFAFGGLAGTVGVVLTDQASQPVDLTVGGNNESRTYSGALSGLGSLTKTGTGVLTLTGTSSYAGTTTVNAGTLLVNGSLNAGGAVTVSGGTLAGTGMIGGAVDLPGGTIAPGDRTLDIPAPGNLDIANAVNLAGATTGGTTEMRLFSATESDVLSTAGLTYGGILKIIDANSIAFAVGNNWDLFEFTGQSGTFSNNSEFGTVGGTYLPLLTVDKNWSFNYTDGILSVVWGLLPGDTNLDRVVDAADYITLKTNLGLTGVDATWAKGNVTGAVGVDGTVDWDDLQVLMANFGKTLGEAPATPEPATLGLLAIGALALLRRRRAA